MDSLQLHDLVLDDGVDYIAVFKAIGHKQIISLGQIKITVPKLVVFIRVNVTFFTVFNFMVLTIKAGNYFLIAL